MCGIAGFAAPDLNMDAAAVRQIIGEMTRRIAHRGPDDAGFYQDRYAALGHRRLSIIDLAAGHQPMPNEDGTLHIVFNGEIFNHAELRPALDREGHRYRTHCDTETILHAYEQHGPRATERLRGMFAFAIWNCETKQLFCARDRLGKKPFYYHWNGRHFVFASEIKAILAHPAVSANLNDDALPEYLAFGYVSSEASLFRSIRQLLPGHCLQIDFSARSPQLRIEQYWDPPVRFAAERRDERDLAAETRSRLETAVSTRLMSDVPLGVFLSGGVDSSAIAALTQRLTGGPVKTFSVGYSEAQYSELGYASQVAAALGADHHEVRIGFDEFFGSLPALIWHEDKPITWPSSVSLYFVSKLASGQVKVVLTGEGADELFGGYERYRWNLLNVPAARLYTRVPASVRRALSNFVNYSSLLSLETRRKLSHTFLAREARTESLLLDNFYMAFPGRELAQIGDPYRSFLKAFAAHPDSTLLQRMLYADQKTYLVELLMKQDRMSMAASIESRVPFLDHEFVEWAAQIPDRFKIRGSEQKYILKKAVEDLLPRSIVYRKKMGFPTPLRAWLRDPRCAPILEALADPAGFAVSHLGARFVRGVLDRHRSGREDVTDRVWRLLNLQIWAGTFLGGNSAAPLEPSGSATLARMA